MPFNVSKWYIRSSVLYAFGVWTMLGTLAYYEYGERLKDKDEDENEEEDAVQTRFKSTGRSNVLTSFDLKTIHFTAGFFNFFNSPDDEPGTAAGGK